MLLHLLEKESYFLTHFLSFLPYTDRVTRIEEILPRWQKFKSLWQIFKSFTPIIIWQNFAPILAKNYTVGPIGIALNGQILKSNQAI